MWCFSVRAKRLISKKKFSIRGKLRKMIKCVCSSEKLDLEEMNYSSESLATRDYSATASGYSSRPRENESKVDNSNIEEAESSLRESGYLNYEVRLKKKNFHLLLDDLHVPKYLI